MNYKKRTYKNERIKKLYYKNNNWSTYRDEGGGTDPWGRALKKAPPPLHTSVQWYRTFVTKEGLQQNAFMGRDAVKKAGFAATKLAHLRELRCQLLPISLTRHLQPVSPVIKLLKGILLSPPWLLDQYWNLLHTVLKYFSTNFFCTNVYDFL